MEYNYKTKPNQSSYIKFGDFASYSNMQTTNVKLWASKSGPSVNFEIGPTRINYGPDSFIGQAYTADYIADHSDRWDDFCEKSTTNMDYVKAVSADILPRTEYTPMSMTIGECNLYNAACRKFLNLDDFNVSLQHFNPDDLSSPMIKMYNIIPYRVARVMVPENPNDNILLNRILDNPDKYLNLLLNMKQNVDKNTKNRIKGTRIDALFQKIDMFYNN